MSRAMLMLSVALITLALGMGATDAFQVPRPLGLSHNAAKKSLYDGTNVLQNGELSAGVPRRGMYVSIYSSQIGRMVLGPTFKYDLDSPANLDQLLRFVVVNQINALTLYNLGVILGDLPAIYTKKLRSFIASARRVGVLRVEAAGGSALGFYDMLRDYQSLSAAESRFDGIITEIEFWVPSNGITVSTVVTVINYCKTKFPASLNGPNNVFDYGVYIGWVNQTQVNTIATVANYVFIHAYVKLPQNAFGYAQPRLNMAYATAKLKAYVIFSAEGNLISASSDPSEKFMGDWMNTTTPKSIVWAEGNVTSAQAAVVPAATLANYFGGFQWYEYYFAYEYMKRTWPQNLPPAITVVPPMASIPLAANSYIGTPYTASALGSNYLRGAAGPGIDVLGLLYRSLQQSVYPLVTTAQLGFSTTVTPPKFTKMASCTTATITAGKIVLVGGKAAVAASGTSIFWVNAAQGAVYVATTTTVGAVQACWTYTG